VDVTVTGAEKLARIAGAANRFAPTLRKELLREIRTGVRPVLPEIRDEAREILPHLGGLSEIVADAKLGVRTRTSGTGAGVRVEGRMPGHDIKSIEDGDVRHPVFARAGKRVSWVAQRVAEGFFSRPLNKAKPKLQRSVIQAMDNAADSLRKA